MMFQGVEVTKVSTNSTRDFIRVSLYSRHLIQKKHIYEVERLLKQQLFARSHIQVSVKEQYDLSEQYTPENLMNEYYDSFLMELDQRSVVERNMLQNASYEFENGNILCLTLTDTIVAQGKKRIRYLHIFQMCLKNGFTGLWRSVFFMKKKRQQAEIQRGEIRAGNRSNQRTVAGRKKQRKHRNWNKKKRRKTKRPKQKATQQEKAEQYQKWRKKFRWI